MTTPVPVGVPVGTEITITTPDDWHLHLRDNVQMHDVVGHSAAWARRALIMPNNPLVRTTHEAIAYRERILSALPKGANFEPLMTLCLTDKTTPEEVARAKQSGIVFALKAYPANPKNNPDTGITDFFGPVQEALAAAQDLEMVLSIHGEVTDDYIDVYDREKLFIDRILYGLLAKFPNLRVSLEHLSTERAVLFTEIEGNNVFGTIAPHYLVANRNDMLGDGIRPNLFCSPILKTVHDQSALIRAATSGNPRFGLGTDSAPWGMRDKYAARGKGGCFNAHEALAFYAEAFDSVGKTHILDGFVNAGADFYGLPRNTDTLTLIREDRVVPMSYPFGNDVVVPLRAGGVVKWKVRR